MPPIRKEILLIHSLLSLLNICTYLCSLGCSVCFSIEEYVESSLFWACVAGVTVPCPESLFSWPQTSFLAAQVEVAWGERGKLENYQTASHFGKLQSYTAVSPGTLSEAHLRMSCNWAWISPVYQRWQVHDREAIKDFQTFRDGRSHGEWDYIKRLRTSCFPYWDHHKWGLAFSLTSLRTRLFQRTQDQIYG